MEKIKIAIGSDHAGFKMKEVLIKHLESKGLIVEDKGCFSEERVDYPDFGHKVALAVQEEKADLGILLCGSGNGINITANKHKGIRAALCWNEEIVKMARLHNDANVLTLPARYISEELAKSCVDTFLSTEFEGGRHKDRIEKINC